MSIPRDAVNLEVILYSWLQLTIIFSTSFKTLTHVNTNKRAFLIADVYFYVMSIQESITAFDKFPYFIHRDFSPYKSVRSHYETRVIERERIEKEKHY